MLRIILLTLIVLAGTPLLAEYTLPNSTCPGDCRQIPWSAGSDQWNSGTLPSYTGVACTSGLTEGNGTTNNASAIQTCLNALSVNQAAVLPAGIYYVNSILTIASNKALRGAGAYNCSQGVSGGTGLPIWALSASFIGDTGVGAACTTLKFGASGGIEIGTTNPTRGSELAINTPTKGDTTVVCTTACTGISVNDWISVFEDSDPDIVNNVGCTWCGENSGSNLIQQFAQVTAVNGTTLTISRPIYYTYKAAQNPGIKEITWAVQRAGVEDLKLHGFADINKPFVYVRALFAWVRGVEMYNASGASSAGHIRVDWSHGGEFRDSYLHTGRSYASGDNYGWFGFFWNSDHKVENNIMRIHRHSTVLEGGGSGIAFLYNYIDDNFEDNDTYNGSARTTHGPQPMFSLWEGNDISRLEADDVFGSSSHIVLFRNWLRGESTDLVDRTGTPTFGFYAIDIRGPARYYSAVGNVLGESSWSSGTVRTQSSANCSAVDTDTRVAYYIGCQDAGDYGTNYDAAANSTFLAHRNWDYLTDGVAYDEGGADLDLADSIYYGSKPDWYGGCTWPPFGPEPTVSDIPARLVFEEGECPPVEGGPTPRLQRRSLPVRLHAALLAIPFFIWRIHASRARTRR